jgi:hypothetical protein
VFFAIAPDATVGFFNAFMHGLDLNAIRSTAPITFGRVLYGIVRLWSPMVARPAGRKRNLRKRMCLTVRIVHYLKVDEDDESLVRDLARGGHPPPNNIQSLST